MKNGLHCSSIHFISKVNSIFICLGAICISPSNKTVQILYPFILLVGDLFLIDLEVLFIYYIS